MLPSLTMILHRVPWYGADWGAAHCERACALRPRDLQRFRAFVRMTLSKIILVADDAGPSLRASRAPIVRMQAMSSDAMAKKFFLELDRPAEEATAAARAAKGDWRQLEVQNSSARITNAQARTLPSLTRPRASWRTSC